MLRELCPSELMAQCTISASSKVFCQQDFTPLVRTELASAPISIIYMPPPSAWSTPSKDPFVSFTAPMVIRVLDNDNTSLEQDSVLVNNQQLDTDGTLSSSGSDKSSHKSTARVTKKSLRKAINKPYSTTARLSATLLARNEKWASMDPEKEEQRVLDFLLDGILVNNLNDVINDRELDCLRFL